VQWAARMQRRLRHKVTFQWGSSWRQAGSGQVLSESGGAAPWVCARSARLNPPPATPVESGRRGRASSIGRPRVELPLHHVAGQCRAQLGGRPERPDECPRRLRSARSAARGLLSQPASDGAGRIVRGPHMQRSQGHDPCSTTQWAACGNAQSKCERSSCRRCRSQQRCARARQPAPLGSRVGGRRTQQSHAPKCAS